MDKNNNNSDIGENESQRNSTISTATEIGHISSTDINVNELASTPMTTANFISATTDDNEEAIVFSDTASVVVAAAEKCADMILSSVFESKPLKSDDNIIPSSAVVPKVDIIVSPMTLLKSAKSDACLLSHTSKHYAHSLNKADLMELKRSIVKSDFKPVQDPLSAPKLRKNGSTDCHPWHSPIFDICSLDSSRYGCESVIDFDEVDVSRPFVLFPSVRYELLIFPSILLFMFRKMATK
uniref:Uncharacterized protein n=1 Tax=Setaria digitata TaxID=48799 RepID=A0A915PUU2_9BILA